MSKCDKNTCGPIKPARVSDTTAADAAFASLAWAVAHPVRVRFFRILMARESCVCGELVGEFDLAASPST